MASSAFSVRSMQSSISGKEGPLQIKPKDYPKPSDSAKEFLDFISDDDFRGLLFEDTLAVTISDGQVGEFVTTVTPASRNQKDCFLVHASSRGTVEGVPCGTTVTAYVSKQLETLEQHHHEYIHLDNHPMEKKSSIVLQDGEYVVNWTNSQGGEVHRRSVTYLQEHLQGLVSEGSNLLLQRLLIKKGMPVDFVLLAFDTDYNICRSPYKSLPQKSQGIEEQFILVTGIERSILSPSDLPTTWQSYFGPHGHLTSRVQVGSPVVMTILSIPLPVDEDAEPAKPIFPKKPLSWEDDLELHSKFTDVMDELKDDHAAYMRKHPELRCLIADFLQNVLLKKPDDVLNFSARFFASFSKRMASQSTYERSGVPNPFSPEAVVPPSP